MGEGSKAGSAPPWETTEIAKPDLKVTFVGFFMPYVYLRSTSFREL
jgi:hypothetical protein